MSYRVIQPSDDIKSYVRKGLNSDFANGPVLLSPWTIPGWVSANPKTQDSFDFSWEYIPGSLFFPSSFGSPWNAPSDFEQPGDEEHFVVMKPYVEFVPSEFFPPGYYIHHSTGLKSTRLEMEIGKEYEGSVRVQWHKNCEVIGSPDPDHNWYWRLFRLATQADQAYDPTFGVEIGNWIVGNESSGYSVPSNITGSKQWYRFRISRFKVEISDPCFTVMMVFSQSHLPKNQHKVCGAVGRFWLVDITER